jgi:hypothetical protein
MLRRTLLKLLATTQQEKQANISKYLHAFIIPRCYVYVPLYFSEICFMSNL